MKRLLAICAALVAFAAVDALGHGGSFRGPNSGVPPGLRTPFDPEPPPPPPSDPGGPGPEITPPGQPGAPDSGHDTPGGGGPPVGPGPTPGNGRAKTTALTFDSWRFWWAYNNDDILNLKRHVFARNVTSSNPLYYGSGNDQENRRDVHRPTQREVTTVVIPALLRTINRAGDHEDIHGGALVALGKIGYARHLAIFKDAIWNRYRTDRGVRVDFGYQATESAVLATGLLPGLDDEGRRVVREICLEAIADDSLRTRERSWAAVSLGLQRDAEAVEPLLELLQQRYADDNVPCGILAGLGLIGSSKPLAVLEHALLKGDLRGKRIEGDRVRAFLAYAIQKIGDPSSLETILKVVTSRKFGRIVKRSAVIAAGALGAKASPEQKDAATGALLRYLGKSSYDSGGNFALIALSQIGTDRGLAHLLDVAESGRYGQRPFAALGLATHVFYRDRDAESGRAEPFDPDLRKKIVAKLAKLSRKFKDNDTKAAFMLARGLVQDRSALDELVSVAASKRKDSMLRGFCCVALGLIGDATPAVKDALKLALRERKSTDLRRDAATGLGLLHDGEVVSLLIKELRRAKSFAVQGQLITAIGTIGDQGAIPPLVQLLDDRSQPAQTRAMAAVGLGMIGDLRDLPALGRLSKNYNYRASVSDIDELLFIL